MISIHAVYRGRPLCLYCLDLRQCLDCCAALRLAGGRVIEVLA